MHALSQQPAGAGEVLLRRRRNDGVEELTLNRPAAFNALSEELLARLTETFESLAGDDGLRAVVLRAEGRAFCAGHDLKEMRPHREKAYFDHLFAACSRMMLAIVALPVPVVARVHGIATAAGCQLVGTCDLAVAARSARFATSGINTGLFCSTPAVALSRNVPAKPAFEMLVTGDFVDAERACALGLVNRVADDDALDEAVEDLVGRILGKSPVAIRTGKAMFRRQLEMPLAEAYAYAAEVMARNMMARDVEEGIDAFIGKRPARWEGR